MSNKPSIKPLSEFLEMGAAKRETFLKATATGAKAASRMIAKVLFAGEQKGDYGPNEMNAYAQRVTGMELRREIQGTYEAVAVLRKVANGTLPLTEQQFDGLLGFAILTIGSLLKLEPDKAIEACEIAVSGVDVVKRLKDLKAKDKEKPAGKGASGDGENGASATVSKIQTRAAPSVKEAFEAFVASLGGLPLIAVPELVEYLASDVENAATQACCRKYEALFGSLQEVAKGRMEALEAEDVAASPIIEIAAAA